MIAAAIATPSLAQGITLQCSFSDSSLPRAPWTVDFDLSSATVHYPGSNVTYRIDQVSDRYVLFGAGVDVRFPRASPFRLDRRTGMIEALNGTGASTYKRSASAWRGTPTC
jgi:hypothetical protein